MLLASSLPVVREETVAQDKPSPLVTLDVIGPFEKPAFVRVSGGRSGRLGLRHHQRPKLGGVRLDLRKQAAENHTDSSATTFIACRAVYAR